MHTRGARGGGHDYIFAAGRNVAMLMSPDGEVSPARVGFMLIIK